jgi:hypothetical protein
MKAPSFLDRMRGLGKPVAKASRLDEELDRLDALLARQERRVREAFAEFVRSVRSPAVLKEAADLIAAGNVEGALQIVDTYVTRMGAVIPRIFQEAAIAEAAVLAGELGRLAPRVAISFDPTDPAAADLMRRASLEFIREFSDRQREAVRLAITEELLRGGGPASMARAFRDAIGLTAYQEGVVRRYRRLLEEGSREALSRELRDKRFDSTVRRATRAKNPEPLGQAQIDRMVERYREKMLRSRAETIAQTEGVRVTAEARDEAFRQAARNSGLDLDLVDEIWNSTRDGRTRETHRAMNRQVRPFGVPFDSPSGAQLRYPGDPAAPASETINCRCHKTRRIRQVGQPFGTPLETP